MTVSKEKARKLAEDCLREMYANAEPEGDWDEIKEEYAGKEDTDFYLKHEISEKKYKEIRDKYKQKIGKPYKKDLMVILLDYAPTFKEDNLNDRGEIK